MAVADPVSVRHFSELEWEQKTSAGSASGPAEAPPVRRKWLTQGEVGLYSQHVQMVAGNEVRPHSHDQDELMVVLTGGCRLDGTVSLGAGDAVTILAGTTYGFVVGEDGMEFLLVRKAPAVLTRPS
jgi:quercetin dioxygenase-like cupin family protein